MVSLIFIHDPLFLAQAKIIVWQISKITPVIFKHTIDMFHGTISWKIKRSFYRNFEKMSAQLQVELVTYSPVYSCAAKDLWTCYNCN